MFCAFLRLTNKESIERDQDAPMRLIPIKITKDYSNQLLRVCKQNGCKIHGTMTTVISTALMRAIRRLRRLEGIVGGCGGEIGVDAAAGGGGGGGAGGGNKLTLLSDFPNGTKEQTVPLLPAETLGCFIKPNLLQQEVEFALDEDEVNDDADDDDNGNDNLKATKKKKSVSKFWEEANFLTQKVTQILKDGFGIPVMPLLFIEHMFRLFPLELGKMVSQIKTGKVSLYLESIVS